MVVGGVLVARWMPASADLLLSGSEGTADAAVNGATAAASTAAAMSATAVLAPTALATSVRRDRRGTAPSFESTA